MKLFFVWLALGMGLTGSLAAALSVPPQFGEGAVLQRDKPLPLWGTARPETAVSISVAGTTASARTDAEGRWRATLPPLAAGGPFDLRIDSGEESLEHDVWVGEVWLASGQSNMRWTIGRSRNADFFRATEVHTEIRLLYVEGRGSDQPQTTFRGEWKAVNSDTISGHSAVAFHFAKALHAVLGVPVGIVENAWGGSAADAWIAREALRKHPELDLIDKYWQRYEEAHAHLDPIPQPFTGNQRPGNIFNTRVHPLIPMALRGVIWYQGESNAGRSAQYRALFPALIENWRDLWDKDDLPFYWVQLAAFRAAGPSGPDDTWAQLRDAQTGTQRLPNTGQVVTIDIGDGTDIHPWEKEEVGRRLARWALSREYGVADLQYRSPSVLSWEQTGNEVTVLFDDIGGGLRRIDLPDVRGFAVAGAEREWMEVDGTLVESERVVLEIPEGFTVKALRYAWASNPAVNIFSFEGLPLTPYRSDDWPWIGEENIVPPHVLDF